MSTSIEIVSSTIAFNIHGTSLGVLLIQNILTQNMLSVLMFLVSLGCTMQIVYKDIENMTSWQPPIAILYCWSSYITDVSDWLISDWLIGSFKFFSCLGFAYAFFLIVSVSHSGDVGISFLGVEFSEKHSTDKDCHLQQLSKIYSTCLHQKHFKPEQLPLNGFSGYFNIEILHKEI